MEPVQMMNDAAAGAESVNCITVTPSIHLTLLDDGDVTSTVAAAVCRSSVFDRLASK